MVCRSILTDHSKDMSLCDHGLRVQLTHVPPRVARGDPPQLQPPPRAPPLPRPLLHRPHRHTSVLGNDVTSYRQDRLGVHAQPRYLIKFNLVIASIWVLSVTISRIMVSYSTWPAKVFQFRNGCTLHTICYYIGYYWIGIFDTTHYMILHKNSFSYLLWRITMKNLLVLYDLPARQIKRS